MVAEFYDLRSHEIADGSYVIGMRVPIPTAGEPCRRHVFVREISELIRLHRGPAFATQKIWTAAIAHLAIKSCHSAQSIIVGYPLAEKRCSFGLGLPVTRVVEKGKVGYGEREFAEVGMYVSFVGPDHAFAGADIGRVAFF